MPTFAEMIYGSAEKSIDKSTDGIFEAGMAGADLALRQEHMQQQRQQLQQEAEKVNMLKFAKITEMTETGLTKVPSKARRGYFKNVVQNAAGQMGIPFSDEFIDGITSPDVNQGALGETINQFRAAVRQGLVTGDMSQANELAAQVGEAFGGDVTKLGDFMNNAIGSELNAMMSQKKAEAQAAAGANRGQGIDARFQQAQKTKLADKLQSLGIPDIKVAITELNNSIPGGIDGYKPGQPIPGISGADGALPTNRLSGKGLQVRQSSLSLGNQILKLRSGAAVSDGEALRTLSELGLVPTIGEGGTWTGLTWKGTTSPEAFVGGMKRARDIVAAKEQVFRKAYGESTYDSITEPLSTKSKKEDELITVYGKSFTKDQWKQFIKLHPNDSAVPEIKKAIGE